MRKGFTLVEMLVVLFIIALMAALIAFTLPGFQTRSRAAKGGSAVQAQLTYARQRAQYEQSPRGVRFHMEQNTDGWWVVRKMQMIEQPDDFTGSIYKLPPPDWWLKMPDPKQPLPPEYDKMHLIPSSSLTLVTVAIRDPNNLGPNTKDFGFDTVQVGDYFELNGTGQVHRIVGVASTIPPNNPSAVDRIELAAPGLTQAITSDCRNYRVIRQTTVSADEPTTMPDDVVIDCDMFSKYAAQAQQIDTGIPTIVTTPTGKYFDVLFAPNGSVLNSPASRSYFWVRVEKDTEFDHNPTLVVVTHKSGNVSAYDPVPGTPFANVK